MVESDTSHTVPRKILARSLSWRLCSAVHLTFINISSLEMKGSGDKSVTCDQQLSFVNISSLEMKGSGDRPVSCDQHLTFINISSPEMKGSGDRPVICDQHLSFTTQVTRNEG